MSPSQVCICVGSQMARSEFINERPLRHPSLMKRPHTKAGRIPRREAWHACLWSSYTSPVLPAYGLLSLDSNTLLACLSCLSSVGSGLF